MMSQKTCPSAPPEVGSMLMGVVVGPGEVAYLSPGIPATTNLLNEMETGGIPLENRLRFSGRCLSSMCVHWQGDNITGKCNLIDNALEVLGPIEDAQKLPHCGIRQTCRWFSQHGTEACTVCPRIVRKPAGMT